MIVEAVGITLEVMLMDAGQDFLAPVGVSHFSFPTSLRPLEFSNVHYGHARSLFADARCRFCDRVSPKLAARRLEFAKDLAS